MSNTLPFWFDDISWFINREFVFVNIIAFELYPRRTCIRVEIGDF